jgi:hypothetical protein
VQRVTLGLTVAYFIDGFVFLSREFTILVKRIFLQEVSNFVT